MPTVSIIVPIYKVEKYLRECLDSILCQTYADFELILVDDGSPDNCGQICNDYAGRDSRIRVIHQENRGLSGARNAALEIACGKYVYFIDSDDTVEPNLLELLIPYMENGFDVAAFPLRGFYNDGTQLEPLKRKTGVFTLHSPEERKYFFYKVFMSYSIGWESCSRFFRRDIIEKFHIRFADNRAISSEDLYFNLCYCAHITKLISLDITPYHYRRHEESITGQQTGKNKLPQINQLAMEVKKHYASCDDCKDLLDNFPFLHFQIIMMQFIFQMQYAADLPAFRQETLSSLNNWSEIETLVRQNLMDQSQIQRYYTPLRHLEVVQHGKFLLGGSAKKEAFYIWLIQRIRNQGERLDRIRALWKKRSSQ